VAGFFAFVWADSVPAVSWSHVDLDRRPKEAALALREALAPVTVAALWPLSGPRGHRPVTVPLWAINDTAWPLVLRITVAIEAMDAVEASGKGESRHRVAQSPERVLEVRVTPDGTCHVDSLSLPPDVLTRPHRLRLIWQARPAGPAAHPGAPPPPSHGMRAYALPLAAWGKAWFDRGLTLDDEPSARPVPESLSASRPVYPDPGVSSGA
jgi:hypothetical protein